MPLTRVKDKYQVTIPTVVRKAAGIKVGDMLETVARGTTIVMRPKVVVDRGEDAETIAREMGFKNAAELKRRLVAGAKRHADRDRQMAEEWRPVEEEAWQKHLR